MRKGAQFLKRAMAIVLAALLLFTNAELVPVAAITGSEAPIANEPVQDGKWHGTTGGLVAENYRLNKYEKDILLCAGIAGDTYAVDVPNNNTAGLVSVDADAETVTAKVYETDGFVWLPTAAVLKYTAPDGTAGTDVTVPLTKVGENYVGSFTKPANSYRVEVTYSLSIAVDAAKQELLLDTPFYLADGYSKLELANTDLGMAFLVINDRIEDLRAIYNGASQKVEYEKDYAGHKISLSFEVNASLPDGDVKTAIGNLLADYDANGGKLTLKKDFDEYAAATSKVEFMMNNGQKVKDDIQWFFEQIDAIYQNTREANGGDLGALADQLRDIADNTLAADAEAAMDDAVGQIVEAAEDEVQKLYPTINLDSLKNKGRKDNAIYDAIAAKKQEFNALADQLALFGQAALAAKVREGAAKLDELDAGIRELYALGDEKVAQAQTTLKTTADEIDMVVDNFPTIRKFVRPHAIAEWEYLGKELLKADVTAEQYAELDKAVKAAYNEDDEELLVEKRSGDVELKAELFATETTVSAMVAQFNVNVKVAAQVVDGGKVDSADTVALEMHTVNFPLDKDTAADVILQKITDSAIESKALANWDPFYAVGETYYNRTVTITDGEGNPIDALGNLTEDITYTITYTPKTYTVTLTDGGNVQSFEAPYGYNWRLPRHEDPAKSYDYTVNGVGYREAALIRVVEDVNASRKEGKAGATKTLAQLILESYAPGASLSEAEKAVLSQNAFVLTTVYYRTPDNNDKLVQVVTEGNGYMIKAGTMYAGIVGTDAQWVPVSATVPGAEIMLTKQTDDLYTVYFETDDEFTDVQVTYQLRVTGLDQSMLSQLVNLPNTLVKDTAEQKAELDALCTQNNFYANLGKVDKTTLGVVGGMVELGDEAKAALKELTTYGMGDKTTLLYDYLTEYKGEKGGLSYYYKSNNAQKIIDQIALVNKNLPAIWNDANLQKFLVENDYSDLSAPIEAVMAQLAAVDLKPVNALVNTNSANIDTLLAAVEAARGNTTEHFGITDTVTLRKALKGAAPGQSSYTVKIEVLDKNGDVVNTYADEIFRRAGLTITAAEVRAVYEALFASIPNNQYYDVTLGLPTEDFNLGEDGKEFVCKLSPVTFTVKIDGEADQILYAFDAYTITLPGTGNAGTKYIYTIGNTTAAVQSGSLANYSLAITIDEMAALFGDDRELVITRKLVDVNKEGLLTFLNDFNAVLANSGLTYAAGGKQNLAVAFIPVEDANGNLSVVLRVTTKSKNLQPQAMAGDMMNLVMGLSYVGLNNNTMFGLNGDGELKLYLQSIINMMLNSGLGFDAFSSVIKTNGDINEFKIAGGKVVGANGNELAVGDKVIGDLSQLGGKLIETTMQYGLNVNNATSVPLYVTYEDFDEQRGELALLKKGIDQVKPYANINLKGGALDIVLNAPDSVYAYMITAMMTVGQIDFDNIQSYEIGDLLDYGCGLIKPMFETEGVGADTIINTEHNTGLYQVINAFDLAAHRTMIDFFYNAIDHVYDYIDAEGTSNGGVYTGTLTYSALDVVLGNRGGLLKDVTGMIAEINDNIYLPIRFELANREKNYEAMVMDLRADGIQNKYRMVPSLSKVAGSLSDDAIVTLLSDVGADLTFNNDVVLNLNGYTVNGDVTAKGTVVIADSTLDTKDCGSVTGKLIANGGTFKIGAGKYLEDVSAYLEEGYFMEGNAVSNCCITFDKNGEDLDVYLSKDFLLMNKSGVEVMAADLMFKLLINYYACAQLTVDGNTVYAIDLRDITGSLNDKDLLINKGLGCFDHVGASAFATAFMNDVTDFGALADAVKNGGALISYKVQNAALNPYMEVVGSGKDSYLTFNIGTSDNVKTTNINVKLAKDIDLGTLDYAASILRELDAVTTFENLHVTIDELEYSSGLQLKGSAAADLAIDLTGNVNYPIIIAAILAADAKGADRAALVKAIKDYQTTFSTVELKKALDEMTIAQLSSALRTTKNKSFASICKTLGITAPAAAELESLYTVARKVVGTLLDRFDIDGNDKALGGLKIDGQFGVYGYRLKKNADTYAEVTLKIFTEQKAITVKDLNGIITLTTDNLADAFAALENGYTIYINKPVALAENMDLPAKSFKLLKAENIDFNGFVFKFVNGNTVLYTDVDLTASLVSDLAVMCSGVQHTMEGELHKFYLDGDSHEWIDVEAVPPTCEEDGWTAAVMCKYCGKYLNDKAPERVPTNGHQYTTEVFAPDCFNEGYTVYTCIHCNRSYESDFVPALNHPETEIIPGQAASCTVDGWTDSIVCKLCGTVIKPSEPIPAAHKPKDVEKPATCTEPGITGETVCEVCGIVLKAGTEIPAKGHGIALVEGYAADCENPGLTSGVVCPDCDHVWIAQEILPALGHVEVFYEEVPADCVTSGWAAGSYCERCHVVLSGTEVIPALGHNLVLDPEVPATTTSTGLTEGYHCDVCGEIVIAQRTLQKLPYIHVPEVELGGEIVGARVDSGAKYLYLDADPRGLTVKEFEDVTFQIDNASTSSQTIYGDSKVLGESDLIGTGDTVTVWAANADGVETKVTYTIIMMGDADCNGVVNVIDLVMMDLYIVGDISLPNLGFLAADMNFDGKIDVRDGVAGEVKIVLWNDGYTSQAK